MKKKNIARIAMILLLTVAMACGYFFVREYLTAQEEISEYADVQSGFTSITVEPVPKPLDDTGSCAGNGDMPQPAGGLPHVHADFDALLRENSDTVGWLAIPETAVSYPVVQAEDNDQYLDVSFKGKRSGAGTLFADKDNSMQALDPVTVIYGHNMNAGRSDMFSSLLSYKEQEYYTEHRFIQFDTIYQNHGWWQVFAVIEHDIRSEDFDYRQLRFTGETDFVEWIDKAQTLSLYDAAAEISPEDHILVLSTCDRSRYGRNGRLLTLAAKMDEE